MSTSSEKQSMQRADLPETSAQWVVLHLSDFPESTPCGVFASLKACVVLVWSTFHFTGGIFLLTFPQADPNCIKWGKKKRFRFESMSGAFYGQLHQGFVPRGVNNLFLKKWKTTGCTSGVPLSAKHSLVNIQANGPLYADVSEPVCGPIHMWRLSWRK